MKVLLILMLAGRIRYDRDHKRWAGLVVPLVLTAVPAVLVMKQPDLGTALLFAPILFTQLYAAGARMRHLALVAGGGAGARRPALLRPRRAQGLPEGPHPRVPRRARELRAGLAAAQVPEPPAPHGQDRRGPRRPRRAPPRTRAAPPRPSASCPSATRTSSSPSSRRGSASSASRSSSSRSCSSSARSSAPPRGSRTRAPACWPWASSRSSPRRSS